MNSIAGQLDMPLEIAAISIVIFDVGGVIAVTIIIVVAVVSSRQ